MTKPAVLRLADVEPNDYTNSIVTSYLFTLVASTALTERNQILVTMPE